MLEIISYNGKWPCLCMGILKVKKDGKEISIMSPCTSGGRICRGEDWDMWAEYGPWEIGCGLECCDELTDEERQQVVDWFNENIEQGCCGGCI